MESKGESTAQKMHEEQMHFQVNIQSIFKSYLDMPVWQLRHLEVSRIIQKQGIKSVLDIGCAQGTLINRLSRSHQIQRLIGIDMNNQVLQRAKCNVYPELMQDNIAFIRKNRLTVQLYQLNVLEQLPLERFSKIQLVTLIQFIQHIKQTDLPILCQKVFSQIKPKFILITTPNQEFNVYFNFKQGQMRHPEHLFQWKRNRFMQFCESISKQYNYDFQIIGIGEHIRETQNGCCSQGAKFTRKYDVNQNQIAYPTSSIQPIYEVKYPLWIDRLQNRIQNEIRNALYKYNYHSPAQILECFKNSKIGKKITQQKQQDQNSACESSKIDENGKIVKLPQLTKQWIINEVKKLKYCGYYQQRDQLFYQYQRSSISEQEFHDVGEPANLDQMTMN